MSQDNQCSTSDDPRQAMIMAYGDRATEETELRLLARDCPDLVMSNDVSAFPPWFLTMVRSSSSESERYVIADTQAYHVVVTRLGPLVSRVHLPVQDGALSEHDLAAGPGELIHDPYGVSEPERRLALSAFETVQRFVRDPEAFRGRFVFDIGQDGLAKRARQRA
jgi:hypothetical protein